MTTDTTRLTELASLAGCTAKAGPDALALVLGHLAAGRAAGGIAEPPELLVGLREPDDAAVYRLSEDRALVVTIDFFAPVVDDPYAYGAIAAANAISDIYAMGAEVTLALNVSGFPVDLDPGTVSEILRGGAEKVAEAGGLIVGGHTIIDEEPKYGLCVLGFVHPQQVLTKAGAQPGDVLYLTKPLGTGVITTAAKFDEVDQEHLAAATESMSRLNRTAAVIAREVGAHALTDVTGFGILGHGQELAKAGAVSLCLDASAIPLLPGAMEYAYRGVLTGGGARNRKHLDGTIRIDRAVSPDLTHLLYDPQTSGGLLMAVAPEHAAEVECRFAAENAPAWRVGEVQPGAGITVRP